MEKNKIWNGKKNETKYGSMWVPLNFVYAFKLLILEICSWEQWRLLHLPAHSCLANKDSVVYSWKKHKGLNCGMRICVTFLVIRWTQVSFVFTSQEKYHKPNLFCIYNRDFFVYDSRCLNKMAQRGIIVIWLMNMLSKEMCKADSLVLWLKLIWHLHSEACQAELQ